MLDSLPLIYQYSITHSNYATNNNNEISKYREEAGLLIRQCKEYWNAAIHIACAYELAVISTNQINQLKQTKQSNSMEIENENETEIIDYSEMFNALEIKDITLK